MKATPKGIAVYGAASNSIDKTYFTAARAVGAELARRGRTVVNGGGSMGLMGATIDGALSAGGKATGVIPRFMKERGWDHPALTECIVVQTMHQRKKTMADLSMGVIALPGGIGTFEEVMEIMTWRQLGLFNGNIVLLDTNGFYRPLVELLRHATEGGFMRPDHFEHLFTMTAEPAEAVTIACTPPLHHDFSRKF